VDELSSYLSKAPGMPYAHPTVEHYSPLFVTLGAAADPGAPGIQVIDGFWMGLSKRSLQVA
jgi:4,5-DOPA dioxygenase extradiol